MGLRRVGEFLTQVHSSVCVRTLRETLPLLQDDADEEVDGIMIKSRRITECSLVMSDPHFITRMDPHPRSLCEAI